MLVVETIAKVRRDHFVNGKGIRAIARNRGLSRNTVRKIIREGFENAGLISHGPHSFRHMLIRLAQRRQDRT